MKIFILLLSLIFCVSAVGQATEEEMPEPQPSPTSSEPAPTPKAPGQGATPSQEPTTVKEQMGLTLDPQKPGGKSKSIVEDPLKKAEDKVSEAYKKRKEARKREDEAGEKYREWVHKHTRLTDDIRRAEAAGGSLKELNEAMVRLQEELDKAADEYTEREKEANKAIVEHEDAKWEREKAARKGEKEKVTPPSPPPPPAPPAPKPQ